MKKIIKNILIVTLLFVCGISYGQNNNELNKSADTIYISKKGFVYQNGNILNGYKRMVETMKVYPDSYSEIKKAKSFHTTYMVMTIATGFVGAFTIGLPFAFASKKHLKKAIKLYNAHIVKT